MRITACNGLVRTSLLMLLAASPVGADELRLEWRHEGAAYFNVYVTLTGHREPVLVAQPTGQESALGTTAYGTTIFVGEPDFSFRLTVTAVDVFGRESEHSNLFELTPQEFCGSSHCNDGSTCTLDYCREDGSCAHLPRNDVCDDFNRCTDDYCTADGCVHEPNSIPCNDGVDCTDADTCADGVCAGASVCSSDSVCSDDVGTCLARDAPGKGQGVPATCKDGILDPDEECDDGVDWWLPGQACRVDCTLVPCGDVDDSGAVTAIDALMTLRTAVGIASCEPAVCNVDDSASPPTASDAFRILRVAVGVALELRCPSSV